MIIPLRGAEFPPPYWSAPGANLYLGDVRDCLRVIPARSVHCVVTSPPYWGLRDYGTNKSLEIGVESSPDCGTQGQAQCGVCFVCSLVGVMCEVYRVLRDDGTCWLNLGDTYGDRGNLVGVPWRVALALQADGWILRQDIIWAKPNPMPESILSRCTKSHEYVFLLSKGEEYHYDAIAIADKSKNVVHTKASKKYSTNPTMVGSRSGNQGSGIPFGSVDGTRNKRDVWVIPTQGYSGAHFATFPPELITPCILAGTSEHGCCAQCSDPWERVVAKAGGDSGLHSVNHTKGSPPGQRPQSNQRKRVYDGMNSTFDTDIERRETIGWRKMCGCQTDDVVPCIVLDPFVGSGTTVATAIQLGRAGIGIDLSETYLKENAIPRIEAAIKGEKLSKPTVAVARGTPLPVERLRGN